MVSDPVDEYIRLSCITANKCLKLFCAAVVKKFGKHCHRQPAAEDYESELQINAKRGPPGMFGSIDCTHWKWKDYPVGWQGQFQVPRAATDRHYSSVSVGQGRGREAS
jgi:hypothetical protein